MFCYFCKSDKVKYKEQNSTNVFCSLNCQKHFYKIGLIKKDNASLIIHISGASGAGKTTLGNKLKDDFGDQIVVKDLDDLRMEFVNFFYGGYKNIRKNDKLEKESNFKWNSEKYQEYIDEFINDQTKPIVFVGLNHMFWFDKDLYYNLYANYKFYIDIDLDLIFEQACRRFINQYFVEYQDYLIRKLIKNNKKAIEMTIEQFSLICNYEDHIKQYKIWENDYRNQKYEFMSREDIYRKCVTILKENI